MGAAHPYREFLWMVKNMREAQREYFSTKSGKALMEAKRWEREVDAILDFKFRPKPLFDEE
jgi:hypothetical protein